MKRLPFLVLAGLLVISCNDAEDRASPSDKPAAAPAKPIDIDPSRAADVIKAENPILIDVRTPDEFATGTIKGSRNIDFNAESFEDELAKLDQSKTYLVYCRSGNRSGQALPIFEKLQLAKLYHLDGGVNAWTADGRPVE